MASDGSTSAQAALATVVKFPWSSAARVRAILASHDWFGFESAEARQPCRERAGDRGQDAAGPGPPLEEPRCRGEPRVRRSGNLRGGEEVRCFHDRARLARSRHVPPPPRGKRFAQRRPPGRCPVLIARKAPTAARRFVVAYDGCPNAVRAIDFLCSLEPSSARATVVSVVEWLATDLAHFGRSTQADPARTGGAQRTAHSSGTRCARRCGRSPRRGRLEDRRRTGEGRALDQILKAADRTNADVLVLGVRGVSAWSAHSWEALRTAR